MRSLEQIAENPRASTISENLILVADPLGHYQERHDELSPEIFDEILDALLEHFIYGESLITRFRSELVGLDAQARFNQVKIDTAYDMLRILLDKKPKPMDDRLAWLWKQRDAITSGKTGLSDGDRALFELVHYTHQWHHFVTKKNPKGNPFLPLQKVSEDGVRMYIRDIVNKGYPNYTLYGWIERVKTRERIVDKLLLKIFEALEKAHQGENFYSQYFGEDHFGIRVLSFTAGTKRRIDGALYQTESVNRWIVDPRAHKKRFRGVEYMIRWAQEPQVPVPLQIQVQLYPHFLLDDFFEINSHPRYRVRREDVLDGFRKKDPKYFDRMKDKLNQALSFLPK